VPSRTFNGPVVPTDRHNVVLREALFHSPVARAADEDDYHVIEVGIREGSNTSWVGTWDQSTQKVDGATPTSILTSGRHGMRLRAGQAVVLRVSAYGTPQTLDGSRVNFRLALVGGRDGPASALVASGAMVADANSRTALKALERQINEGGLSEWEEAVQITDPVALVATGTFGGRLQYDSTTQISLQAATSNWVEVDGEGIALGSSGLVCLSTDYLLSSAGTVTATAPSSSTLYYVYVGDDSLRLSATAPTRHNGTYYLGTDAGPRRWRFVGWVYLNASTQFADDSTNRLVVNYYNRLLKPIELKPGYVDDNAATTYTTTSTTWTAANAGTNATGSYIANGEDGVYIVAFSTASNSGANTTRIGIGENSGTTAVSSAAMVGTTIQEISCVYATVPAVGRRTVVLLVNVTAGTGTYLADGARTGGTADPVLTGLYAQVRV
jgi:hypothetical protein